MMKRHGRAAADQSYGGVFVYNRPEQVLEQYDLEVRAVSKGRESYICDTTQGQLLLKEYKGSAERAEFLSAILGHLGGQGLLTEQVVRTKEDAPIAVAEDETKYMVLTAVSGSECDTRNRADMIAGAEKLAMLHNAAGTYSETVPEFVCNDPNELQELYEKHNRELVKVRNYIRSKKKKNDFEVLFYGQYERFMEKARQIIEERDGCCRPDESVHILKKRFSRTLYRRQFKTLQHSDWISQKTGGEPLIFRITDRKNAAGMGKSRSADGSRFVRMSAFIWGMST